MLVRFVCLAVAHVFTALRLLLMTDREKDVEVLVLRHPLAVQQRQLGDRRLQLRPERALLVPLGRSALRRLRLLVSSEMVLRWRRALVTHRHA